MAMKKPAAKKAAAKKSATKKIASKIAVMKKSASKNPAKKNAPTKAATKASAIRGQSASNSAPAKSKMAKPVKAKPAAKTSADWRDARIEAVRGLIRQALPDAVEEIKWRKPSNPAGVPTWSLDGLLCTGERYKDKVKLTFAKGARLPDPARLFNASLEGNLRRAIDLGEGDSLDAAAFKNLLRAAAACNREGGK